MVSVNDINFRILAYEVDVGIFVCDAEGTFIYANLALADIFEVKHPSDVIGKNFKEFISPDRANNFMNRLRKSAVSGTKSQPIWTEIIRQNAKTAYIEVNAMPFIKNHVLVGSQGVVQDITQFRQAVDKMMHTSTHDPLTGIYNRTFFEAEMKRLGRGRQFPISIIVISVEGLNKNNETEDHEGRDKLMIRIARQLFYAFRGDDIVARVEEDEFAILLPNVAEKTVQEIVHRTQGDLHKIKIDNNVFDLKFIVGMGTAKQEESVISALKKAEAIVSLKKRSDLNR